ncbi:MAG: Acyl carrier protein [Eubacteriales bacterium SKADARSKE-1]|nr:Acyl carrier protein [Eubacteriales bacterium SKADARSKE-1]
MSEIEKKVREELGKIIGKDGFAIPDDANLIEDVGMDSLNILEVFGMIEDTFKVLVPSEKISEMKTIKDIVSIITEAKNK